MEIKFYELAAAFDSVFDDETGECLDPEAFENIKMAEAEKLEGFMAAYLRKKAMRDAIKAQKMELAKHQATLDKTLENMEKFLDSYMQGRKFEGIHGKITYRKSTTTECTDSEAFMNWDGRFNFLEFEPKPKKDAIGKAIEAGEEIPGYTRVQHNNIGIK